MSESTQHKLDRVRPPRVQITYDVEIGGAIQMKELPFVVGILADLAGQQDALPRFKERKFTQIDRDNYNQVLANIAPKLKYAVPNHIKKEGNLGVDLTFRHIDDFHPTAIAKAVPQLRELLEMRQRLVDLLTKLDRPPAQHSRRLARGVDSAHLPGVAVRPAVVEAHRR
jgi:type VI secretion system protein ImpB